VDAIFDFKLSFLWLWHFFHQHLPEKNKIGVRVKNIVVYAQRPYFSHYDIFHFLSSKYFQTGRSLVCFSFHVQKVIPNRLPLFSFPPFQFYPLPRGQLFLLIRFFIYLMYVKPIVPINKQLSIDWEGHL